MLDSSKKTSGEISTDIIKLISAGCSLDHITFLIDKMFSIMNSPENSNWSMSPRSIKVVKVHSRSTFGQ